MATNTQTLDRIIEAVRGADKDGIDLKELAVIVGVTPPTTTKAVNRLVEEGKVGKSDEGKVYAIMRQGRRSVEVIERDQKILGVIQAAGTEGLPLSEIAEHAGTTTKLAYQSVWRLREAGSIFRVGHTRNAHWTSVPPVESE